MRQVLFWTHSAFVFFGGILWAWFVQDQKIQLEIESDWGFRFFLLIVVFGSLALFFWFLTAGLCSAVSGRENSSFLQADAYSYFAFFPLASYQNLERIVGLPSFIVGIMLFFLLLKILLLTSAFFDRMPRRLKFSFSGKTLYPAFFFLMVAAGTHYAHQTSLVNYWTDIQERRAFLVGEEARNCLILPAGCSIEYEEAFPEGGALWLSYAVIQKEDNKQALQDPRRLTVYVSTSESGKRKTVMDIRKVSAWTDVNIDLGGKVSPGIHKIRVSAGGGMRLFTLPWVHPLRGVLVAGPKVVARADSRAPIIILVTVDSLRGDHIHSHGYRDVHTPTLDSLAADGVTFTNAISAATWTIPSNIAMLSSIPVAKVKLDLDPGILIKHMMLDASSDSHSLTAPVIQFERLPYYTLLDALASNYYMTAAVTDGGWISSETAFMNEFYIFREYRCHGPRCRAEKNFEAAARIIDSWKDGPLFLWIYSNEVHNTTWHPSPTEPCDADNQQEWIEQYDNAIESLDRALGDFIQYLKEEGLYDDTIIILSSDHGNAFGELHNEEKYIPCGHGGIPYGEQTNIPLIVKARNNSGIAPGKVIKEYVSNIDIAPTLLDLVGLKIPEQFDGVSLVGAMRGDSSLKGRRVYSDAGVFDMPAISYVEDSRKIILFPENPKEEMLRVFDLLKDPDEQVDISQQIPDRQNVIQDLDRFLEDSAKFKEQVEQAKPKGEFGDELLEQIKNLGYLQ